MRTIQLNSRSNKSWAKHFVDKKDFDELLNENAIVKKPNGDLLCIFLKKAIPQDLNNIAWQALKKWNPVTENRGTASGISAVPRKKLDGTMSKVTRVPKGWEVISGVLGYFERTVRTPFCHSCSWNAENPKLFGMVLPLIQKVDELYRQHATDKWQYQKTFVDKTQPEYVIKDTVFTTVTFNKNFRTAAHKDAGDLENGFSCLTVIQEGKYKGGELVFPDYRVAANVEMGDLILFDPHEYHGNTQIIPLTKKYTRCSMVYYYRELMQHCLPIEDEIERAKRRKEGDKLWD